MSESDRGPLTPDVPRPPGTPDVDLDVDVPDPEPRKPETQDAGEDAGEVEPPS